MQTVIKRHLSFVRVQRLRSSVQFSFFLFFNFIIAAAADSATVLPLFRDLKAAWGTRNVYSRATFQNNLIFYPRLLAFLNKKKTCLSPRKDGIITTLLIGYYKILVPLATRHVTFRRTEQDGNYEENM